MNGRYDNLTLDEMPVIVVEEMPEDYKDELMIEVSHNCVLCQAIMPVSSILSREWGDPDKNDYEPFSPEPTMYLVVDRAMGDRFADFRDAEPCP